jgi:hypothetical protein
MATGSATVKVVVDVKPALVVLIGNQLELLQEAVARFLRHAPANTPEWHELRAAYIASKEATTSMDKTADQELAAARAELAGRVPEVQDVLDRQEEHDADRR